MMLRLYPMEPRCFNIENMKAFHINQLRMLFLLVGGLRVVWIL